MTDTRFFGSLRWNCCVSPEGSSHFQGFEVSLVRTSPRSQHNPPQTRNGASPPLCVPHPNIHSILWDFPQGTMWCMWKTRPHCLSIWLCCHDDHNEGMAQIRQTSGQNWRGRETVGGTLQEICWETQIRTEGSQSPISWEESMSYQWID